jgi:hypothetical protein
MVNHMLLVEACLRRHLEIERVDNKCSDVYQLHVSWLSFFASLRNRSI